MRKWKKYGVCLCAAALLVSSLLVSAETEVKTSAADNTASASADSNQEQTDSFKTRSYEEYSAQYTDKACPAQPVKVDAVTAYASKTDDAEVKTMENVGGRDGAALYMNAEGSVTFRFEVPAEGRYHLVMHYYPIEGKGSTIQRSLRIDGEMPFEETRSLSFYRIFADIGEKKYSNSDNEYRRDQQETPRWVDFALRSTSSYLDDYFSLYFSAGTHELTLDAINEPLLLAGFTLCQLEEIPSYADRREEYRKAGYERITSADNAIHVSAEEPSAKSSATFYAMEDRTSSLNEPFSITKTRLNTIGGNGWSYQGDWLEWKISVKESGLYKLCVRAKQNYKSGTFSTRVIYIDGELPFAEANDIRFRYNNNWQIVTPSDGEGDPYLFYLSAGEHTVRMEVSLAGHSDILRDVQESVDELSRVYRRVIMLTGTQPDSLRDYKLKKNMPEIFDVFEAQIKVLERANEHLIALSGGKKGEQSATIDKLLVQLRMFCDEPDKIPENLTNFNDNISSLAAWLLSVSEQPLLLDYFDFLPVNAVLPRADASVWTKIWVEMQSFFLSFVNDYNTIEDSNADQQTSGSVELWLAGNAGRDQATSIKTLADNYFTTSEGVRLAIRLVDMDVLLRAVSANEGPDVAIFQSQSTPINYALRSALQNLSEFEDIDEVAARFNESALVPLTWNGNLYALPEQQTFLMMFYRKDVLYDLGLGVPNTWDEFYAMIPTIQNNNLCVGVPSPVATTSGSTSTAVNDMLVALLYQNGLSIFNEDFSRCVLNTPEAAKVFTTWTELYTKYKIDKTISEINRFRTGEAPIVITSYTFYNTLQVAAPEINGLWSMSPVPGTVQADGSISRAVGSSGTNVIMFGNAKDKEASWKFMKWWTSAEIQTLYGREIEILQGTSARWPTANLEAMSKLPWPSEIAKALQTQWKEVQGVPEVAGGYYVGRNIDNAIKQVINQGQNPRETIFDYVDLINEEIVYKRQELGLE